MLNSSTVLVSCFSPELSQSLSRQLTLSFELSLSPNNSASAMRLGSDEKLRTTSVYLTKKEKTFLVMLHSFIETQSLSI